jgi:hypothetical protein
MSSPKRKKRTPKWKKRTGPARRARSRSYAAWGIDGIPLEVESALEALPKSPTIIDSAGTARIVRLGDVLAPYEDDPRLRRDQTRRNVAGWTFADLGPLIDSIADALTATYRALQGDLPDVTRGDLIVRLHKLEAAEWTVGKILTEVAQSTPRTEMQSIDASLLSSPICRRPPVGRVLTTSWTRLSRAVRHVGSAPSSQQSNGKCSFDSRGF